MQETWVRSLGWENPLEKGKATQYSGLENSMGCVVHGVPKSLTRLSDFRFHLQSSHLLSYSIVSILTNGNDYGIYVLERIKIHIIKLSIIFMKIKRRSLPVLDNAILKKDTHKLMLATAHLIF